MSKTIITKDIIDPGTSRTDWLTKVGTKEHRFNTGDRARVRIMEKNEQKHEVIGIRSYIVVKFQNLILCSLISGPNIW